MKAVAGQGVKAPSLGQLFEYLSGIPLPQGVSGNPASKLLNKSFLRQLGQAFRRAALVKNLIYKSKPAALRDIYVSPILNCGQSPATDDDLVRRLISNERIVVQGRAGLGKSMLARYVTLEHLKESSPKIPLFAELRKLGFEAGSRETLLDKIFSAYYINAKPEDRSGFDEALQLGYFTLILDGFDELDDAVSAAVETQITELAVQYPSCGFLVSGRPTQKFQTWEQFVVYDLQPMTLDRTVELIEKIDYDEEVKCRFVEKLRSSELVAADLSLIGTPLMAVLVLLNYESFAEIPSKTYLFYRQAFLTLMRGHDATKSQFRRAFASGVDDDVLESLFRTFCAITYSSRKYSFTNDEILAYIGRAICACGLTVKPDKVLEDLVDKIGVLYLEGQHYSFIHRTFQEYFMALYLSQASFGVLDQVLRSRSMHTADNVLGMLMEMDRDRIEADWLLPELETIFSPLPWPPNEDDLARFVITYWRHLSLKFDEDGDVVEWAGPNSPTAMFVLVVSGLYYDRQRGYELYFLEGFSGSGRIRKLVDQLRDRSVEGIEYDKHGGSVELDLDYSHIEMIISAGFTLGARALVDYLATLRDEIKARIAARQSILADMIPI